MTYIINAAFGGFKVPSALRKQWGVEADYGHFWDDDAEEAFRTSHEVAEWVNEHEAETDLRVVHIPDEATDWEMAEYDGFESIIAVVDGKIIHLHR